MLLTATDLPEPVVPATSRCGILARLTLTGAPLMSLPSATCSLMPAPVKQLSSQDLLQVDGLAGLVGHLDADHRLAGDRRDDAHRLRLQRHRQVLLQVGDLAGARARRRRELVHGDDRAHVDLSAPCRARRSSTSPAPAARPCRRAPACPCRAPAAAVLQQIGGRQLEGALVREADESGHLFSRCGRLLGVSRRRRPRPRPPRSGASAASDADSTMIGASAGRRARRRPWARRSLAVARSSFRLVWSSTVVRGEAALDRRHLGDDSAAMAARAPVRGDVVGRQSRARADARSLRSPESRCASAARAAIVAVGLERPGRHPSAATRTGSTSAISSRRRRRSVHGSNRRGRRRRRYRPSRGTPPARSAPGGAEAGHQPARAWRAAQPTTTIASCRLISVTSSTPDEQHGGGGQRRADGADEAGRDLAQPLAERARRDRAR